MKNTKKFLLGVFAMSALMLGACSGGQKPAPSSSTEPAPTSSTEPAPEASSSQATSSDPEASTSVAPESSSEPEESTSAEEETSSEADPEESSSQEEEVTEHTVTLNEAPTEGRVVVAHGWKGTDDIITAAAVVVGANVTFDLQTNDLDGYLIAELKEGKTFTDFVDADPEDGKKRDWTVVERQTYDVTDMSATSAVWSTKVVDISFDTSFTTQFGSSRTVYLNSWRLESSTGAGDGAAKLDKVVGGKALLISDADAFELVVLKADETELITGDDGNWDEVVDAESVKGTTIPTSSIKAYYSANAVVLVNDGGELVTHEHTVTVNEAPAATHKVFAYGWKGSANFKAEATVSGAAVTFDLGTDDLEGYIIVELKDGETTLTPGQGGNWDEVVLRQTNDITSMTATTATWKTPKPADTTSYIAIAQGGDWNNMKYVELAPNTKDSKADTEAYALSVSLAVGDLIYIRTYFSASSNGWLHYDQIKSESPVKTTAFEKNTDNDGNIKVKLAGSYDFYCTATQIYVDAAAAA